MFACDRRSCLLGTRVCTAIALTRIDSTEGLGTVFDHSEMMRISQIQNMRHFSGVSVEMDRQDRFGLGGDGGGDRAGVEIKASGVDVYEDGFGTDITDGFGGGEEAEGGGDHLIARTNVEGAQGDDEGVGAGVDTDSMGDPQIVGGFLFKGGHFWTENELTGFENAVNGRLDFRAGGCGTVPANSG